jgi:hypothetical protein
MPLALSLGKFYGIDSLVETLIITVCFVIAYYSYKFYRLVKDKNYRIFSFAFLAIAISFIFKILSNLTILHKVNIHVANFIFVVLTEFESVELINFISLILYKSFYLIGFLFFFIILTKTSNREKIFLFFYLSFIAILFSIYFDFVFHLTIIFILVFLTYNFFINYNKRKNINTFLVFFAFLLLSIDHLFFILEEFNPILYIIGEILSLVGFLCLLLNYIKLKNEKTNTVRSNKRYLKDIKRK